MSYDSWLEYLEPEIMGNDDMPNPTCHQCNTPLSTRNAMLVMGQVAIWLQCDNGHDTVEIVPVSRFVTPTKDCSICQRDGIIPPAAGQRVQGSRWSEARQRNVVFNGYACEMHQDSFSKIRFL